MTIDILTYELKYKNDPMVLELLSAYQDQDNDLKEKIYAAPDIEAAEDGVRSAMKSEIEDYADDIESSLDLMKSDSAKAVEALEKLAERMRA